MLSSTLHQLYYYKNKTDMDEMLMALDCFEAPLFFSVREYVSNEFMLRRAFLKSMVPQIEIYEGKISKLGTYKLKHSAGYEDSILLCPITPTAGSEITILDKLLSTHNFVMVQTVNTMLPFDSRYGEEDIDTILDNFKPMHTHLLIGFDQDYYYYVENKMGINWDNFISCDENREVGKIEKTVMLAALEKFAVYFTIQQLVPEMFTLNRNSLEIDKRFIREMISAYRLPKKGDILLGKEALMFLLNLCKPAGYKMNSKVLINNRDDDFYRIVIMCIDDVSKAVTILRYYLSYIPCANKPEIAEAIVAAQTLSDLAANITFRIHMHVGKGEYIFTQKMNLQMEKYIEQIDCFVAKLAVAVNTDWLL